MFLCEKWKEIDFKAAIVSFKGSGVFYVRKDEKKFKKCQVPFKETQEHVYVYTCMYVFYIHLYVHKNFIRSVQNS